MALGGRWDQEEGQVPEGRRHPNNQGCRKHPQPSLEPRLGEGAPSELLPEWAPEQENQEKGRGKGKPAGGVPEVGEGATLQQVNAQDREADHGGQQQGGGVPAKPDAPAKGLAEQGNDAPGSLGPARDRQG